jgi:hypothetical protein
MVAASIIDEGMTVRFRRDPEVGGLHVVSQISGAYPQFTCTRR